MKPFVAYCGAGENGNPANEVRFQEYVPGIGGGWTDDWVNVWSPGFLYPGWAAAFIFGGNALRSIRTIVRNYDNHNEPFFWAGSY